MRPVDLVGAAPWRRVAFTTYALSLSFFEAVVLDALVRGGGRDALILTDPDGVRAALCEHGARRAGREYEVEPIACATGVFHAKVGVLLGRDDAHLLVGSGNLTFGGWGANLEGVEHLHPSFAADAFADVADLFGMLTIDERIRTGVGGALSALEGELRSAAEGGRRRGDVRVLHSIGGRIADQLVGFADELGGAERATVVSPYFDGAGRALRDLADALGLDRVEVHAHPAGPVRGAPGQGWPAGADDLVRPVLVEEECFTGPRPLHAKAIEVMCRRGRIVLSGSANVTRAALQVGNVEACAMRLWRERVVGWRRSPALAPSIAVIEIEEPDASPQERVGVLRAVLDGDAVMGTVVCPVMSGPARLECATGGASLDLGPVSLDAQGRFEASAPELEARSWAGGRLVLRVAQGDRAAEGFVTMTAASEIVRRAGAMATRLLAMLAGTETPADVAAVLAWFKEDPTRLGPSGPSGGIGSGDAGESSREPVFVPLAAMRGAVRDHVPKNGGGPAGMGWERAIALVRAAFSEPRGPWDGGSAGKGDVGEDDDGEETEEERKARLAREAEARRKAMADFEHLLDHMLAVGCGGRNAAVALAVAHYLADRNRPEPVRVLGWLRRIVPRLGVVEGEDAGMAHAAALLLLHLDRGSEGVIAARRLLLSSGLDPTTSAVPSDAAPGFVAVLSPGWSAATFLSDAASATTPGEQARAFLSAAKDGGSRDGFPLLQSGPVWDRLARALGDPAARARLIVVDRRPAACPRCNIAFNRARVEDLLRHASTFCCRTIVCTEI